MTMRYAVLLVCRCMKLLARWPLLLTLKQLDRAGRALYKTAFIEQRKSPWIFRSLWFAGAREILQELAARPNIVLGVATGKSRRKGVDVLFEREGLQ